MATLSGMTGFGRASGDAVWGTWTIEAKSVNGKGLDVRVNLPGGFEALDRAIRNMAAERFKRGSLQVSVRIEAAETGGTAINHALLDELTEAWLLRTGEQMIRAESLAALMTVRGVVEPATTDLRALGAEPSVMSALTEAASNALDALQEARHAEGDTLNAVLSGALDAMHTECGNSEAAAAEQTPAIKARLESRIAELLGGTKIEEERIATEVAIMASKADVREELDRIAAHIETGRNHLATGSPMGRKLDFLSQELYREANTLCSKSASLALTQAGLALKGLIDQFKEQAANVE
ncbi:MAG: YicC/YloC family endoribonuclease [Pseudomonadota bacterium]